MAIPKKKPQVKAQLDNTKRELTGDSNRIRQLVERKVRENYSDAKEIIVREIVRETLIGGVFYTEFETEQLHSDDSYFYLLINKKNNIDLFDGEEEMIRSVCQLMERNFLQDQPLLKKWLSSLNMVDVLAFLVAITICVVLGLQASKMNIVENDWSPGFSKEIIGLMGIMVGYLFAKRS